MLASQRLANTQQQLHLANICGIRSGNKVDVFKTTVKQKRMYRLLATSWLARQQGGVHIKTHKNTFDTNRIFDHLCTSLLARHPLGQCLVSSCLPSSCPLKGLFREIQVCHQHGWELFSLHDLGKAIRKFSSGTPKRSARHMPRRLSVGSAGALTKHDIGFPRIQKSNDIKISYHFQ